jgi:hypothetical protein
VDQPVDGFLEAVETVACTDEMAPTEQYRDLVGDSAEGDATEHVREHVGIEDKQERQHAD